MPDRPIPFAPNQPNYGSDLSDIFARRGQVNAQAEYEKGAASANMWLGIGQAVNQVVDAVGQHYAGRRERDLRDRQLGLAEREMDRKEHFDEVEKLARNQPIPERIKIYEQAGFTQEADTIRQSYDQRIQSTISRIEKQKTALGKATMLFQEMQAAPDREAFRPALVELAAQLDNEQLPQLAQQMPLDDTSLQQLGEYIQTAAQGVDQQARIEAGDLRVLRDWEKGLKTDQMIDALRRDRAGLFALAKSEDEFDAIGDRVESDLIDKYGEKIAGQVLEPFREWSEDMPEKAKMLALTPAQRAAQEQRDQPNYRPEEIVVNGKRMRANFDSKSGKYFDTEGKEITGNITGYERPYANQGGGGDTPTRLTANQLDQIEEWRANQLLRQREWRAEQLEAAAGDDAMTKQVNDEYEQRIKAIDASYNRRMGKPPEPGLNVERGAPGAVPAMERENPTPSPIGGGRANAAPAQPAKPATVPARQSSTPPPRVGQTVNIKGVPHRVTEVRPDGKFKAVPVMGRGGKK